MRSNLRHLVSKESILKPIPLSRQFHQETRLEVEISVPEIYASSERPVPSLVLAFDLESGSAWKGLVVPSVKTAEICLRSGANAVTSLSAPTTM